MILRLTAIRTENQAFDEQVCSDFFDVVGHDLFSQGLGDVDAAEGGAVSLFPPAMDDEHISQLIFQQYSAPMWIILVGDLIARRTAASNDLVSLSGRKAHEIAAPIEPNRDESVGIEIGMLARREPCGLGGQA
jgi:hypothetical protein